MSVSKFYNCEIPRNRTQDDLEYMVIPRRLRTQVERRVQCAELLIMGYSYNQIIAELHCSTAFIAAVAKRLRAAQMIK